MASKVIDDGRDKKAPTDENELTEKTEPEPSKENLAADEGKSKDGAKNANPKDEWTKLMGDNIQLKDLGTADEKKGEECQPQDAAIVDFVGRLAQERDDEDGPIFHEAKDCLIVVGEKYVNPALEMGVRFMHEGQSAILWSHSKFAYGLSTRKWEGYELPPYANVRYEITVKSIISPNEEGEDPDAFQLKLALSKKLIANDLFKNELYNSTNQVSEQRAVRLYSKAADEMLHLLQTHASKKEADSNYKEEEHKQNIQQATEIMLDSLNNVAAVYLKAKKYHEAKEAAIKVLTHDPTNFKALLRAARAAMMDPSGTYEESDAAIAAAEKVVEEKSLDDKDVRKLRQELKQKKQEYKKRKKEMMARMTKELKVKEEQPQANATEDSQQATETSARNETAEAYKQVAEAEEAEESPPLWRRYLPYAVQIIFPFVLYYLVVLTSNKHQQHISKGDDEL